MKILSNLDLSKNELQNARIQNLATAPANPVPGQIFFHAGDQVFYGWDGSAWVDLGQELDGSEIVALINNSASLIDDTNLSAAANDAIDKRHAHSNKATLDQITAAYTTAEKDKLAGISTGATKVEQSSTNGNIKIDGAERTVYTHPGSGTNPHGTTKADVGLGSVDNVQQASKTEFNAHTGDAVKHITAGERSGWNAKTDKYAATLGNGSATQFTVTHNLGSMDVLVGIRETAAPYNVVYADVQIIDANSVLVLFGAAPSSGQYRATVIG